MAAHLHVAISADNESGSNRKFRLIALIASVVGSLALNPRTKERLREAAFEANDTFGIKEQPFANSGLCFATSAAFSQNRTPASPHCFSVGICACSRANKAPKCCCARCFKMLVAAARRNAQSF